jgi:hypothetical protein
MATVDSRRRRRRRLVVTDPTRTVSSRAGHGGTTTTIVIGRCTYVPQRDRSFYGNDDDVIDLETRDDPAGRCDCIFFVGSSCLPSRASKQATHKDMGTGC